MDVMLMLDFVSSDLEGFGTILAVESSRNVHVQGELVMTEA
jgi:hypothetical protein